jgi:hypothetical protein
MLLSSLQKPRKTYRHDLVELLKEEIGLDPSVHCVTNALKHITDIIDDKGTTTIGPGDAPPPQAGQCRGKCRELELASCNL